MSRSRLQTAHLSLAYSGQVIIEDLEFVVPPGQMTILIGPNGCGKSTLLKGLARLLKPQQGQVLLDGHAIATLPTRALAQQLGILPQGPTAPSGLTVRDLVCQGRYPYQNWWQSWSAADEARVTDALQKTETDAIATRPLDTLSGGQRQRAWIAMVLAQDTDILLLDEPTTFLDWAHQIEILDLLANLNRQEQRTIALVLHDLNQAARYAEHLVVMHSGQIVAQGAPAAIMTETLIETVFNLPCKMIRDPVTGSPLCIPLGRTRRDFEAGGGPV